MAWTHIKHDQSSQAGAKPLTQSSESIGLYMCYFLKQLINGSNVEPILATPCSSPFY